VLLGWRPGHGFTRQMPPRISFKPCPRSITASVPILPQGADVGEQLEVLAMEDGQVAAGVDYVPLKSRVELLRAWAAKL